MPEGDTIHRLAARLAPALVGKRLERVTTQGLVRDLTGTTVRAVTAHGKHLVIELEDGGHIRAHLGMYGRQRSWPIAEGARVLARTSPGRVSLALHVEGAIHLWLGAKTIELAARRAPGFGLAVSALGPDLLADDFEPTRAAARAAEHGTRPIADVLLDQRIAAGIGNVYKSEVLFVVGIAPRTRVATLAAASLVALYTEARALMLANLGPGPRTTRDRLAGDAPDDDRYFVYGRTGKPCRRCGGAIAGYQLGEPARWTWSCAGCQPETPAGGVRR